MVLKQETGSGQVSYNDADVITGRIAAKRQTAGIKFTHRPKIRFFAPQGRLVAPMWQGRRARGSAWLRKISPQSPQEGGNADPKISKISTFW